MPLLTAPTLLVVTPYLASANNGNWRTATRWARLLSPHYRVIVQSAEAPVTGADRDDAIAMIALHARRSRPAIAAWREARPDRALIVALTGTDLYKDLPAGDADTRGSIADADRLIVLQDDAPKFVPQVDRGKIDVVFQSARALAPWSRKREDRLHCVLVAHLRPEKDPATVFAAWRTLSTEFPRSPPTRPDSAGNQARAPASLPVADGRRCERGCGGRHRGDTGDRQPHVG